MDNQKLTNQDNTKLGVKTSEGKAVSKYNAQTHGILRISVTEYEQEFYSNILQDLEAEYKPQGITEQIFVERIAISYLRLFRIQKAETEYIKSQLNPKVTKELYNIDSEEVISDGYTPKIGSEGVEKLLNIYARYETTIENRFFRALHELERAQKVRKGENVLPSLPIDVNQVSSFGETGQNV